jgi:glucokinase
MSQMLGIDLGGTNMSFGIVDAKGKVLTRSKIPTLTVQGPKSVIRRMGDEALRLLKSSGIAKSVKAVGIGSPGPLSAQKGLVFSTPNLPGWRKVPIAALIHRRLRLPVYLENDANCAALGEASYGAGKGFQNVVVLTLGTGVGGGLIINGELFSGPDTTGGELGHFSINPDGPACGCGQKGCIEQYASATAIARRARELVSKARKGPLWKLCGGDPRAISSRMVHQALLKRDPLARQVWAETGRALGTAVAGYINVFNPDRVILFGGVMQGGKELLAMTRRFGKAGAFPQPAKRAKILSAKLGDDAGLIGAAEMARRSLAVGHAI